MNYEIIFDEKTIDYLKKLPKNISKRIFDKIQSTKNNPFYFFKKLEGRSEFKLRIGDYRVIADINRNKITIYITYINHRKKVYKR